MQAVLKGTRVAAMVALIMLPANALGARDLPLATGNVFYVDAATGDDKNTGSRTTPWRTIDKVSAIAKALRPGDSVLFRRGRSWKTDRFDLDNVHGAEGGPITFGSYGPGPQLPSLQGDIRVDASSYLVFRGLDVNGSAYGPCLAFRDGAHHITVADNEIHDCHSNGVAYQRGVHKTVTLSNRIYNIRHNDGVSVHDTNWGETPGVVGDHHWIIDNVLPGNYGEDAIDVATGKARDFKIIGNRIQGARLSGIVVGHSGRFVWILGNTIANSGLKGSGSLRLGGTLSHENPSHYQVRGNILFNNRNPVRTLAAALFFENNTLIESSTRNLSIGSLAHGAVIQHNLFVRSPSDAIVVGDGQVSQRIRAMNFNWFSSTTCQFLVGKKTLSLSQWRNKYGHDWQSRCSGDVPGVSLPPERRDPASWNQAFFASFVPSPTWAGCSLGGAPVGAFDCNGNRQGVTIRPFSDLADNDGYGWAGTVEVQRRYPLPQSSAVSTPNTFADADQASSANQ